MNSFTSWVGGKKLLRDMIVACFPKAFNRYIEVFGGAAWVLFHKPPTPFEVYNDFNPMLVNLFWFVRYQSDELKDALRYTLNSRDDFNAILKLYKEDAPLSDLEKAVNFYRIIRHSYASGCTSFSCQPHSMWSDYPAIDRCNERLQRTGVIIENKSFEKLIAHYDDTNSFFYLDPPYFGTEGHYAKSNFTAESHTLLRDILISINGKFLLSYNDCEMIRNLYDLPGIVVVPISRLNNIKQRYEGGAEYKELLIANYDILSFYESYTVIPEQLCLT